VVGRVACLLLAWSCAITPAFAAPARYALGEVVSIDIPADAYSRSLYEDKRVFNCDRFKLRPADVRFALRHARQVREALWMDDMKVVSVGCHASVLVKFRNGDEVDVTLQPTGKIFARPRNGRAAGQPYFYLCRRCEDSDWWDDPERPRPTSDKPR
jgi:hypothetical protein